MINFPVSETFTSIQGEGSTSGLPTHFIRLAGCNLAIDHGGCTWCDTRYAQRKEQAAREMSLEDLIKGVPLYPKTVCLTGGEPLMHEGLVDLIERLWKRGKSIVVETNGSIPIPAVRGLVSWSVDVKCPSSRMDTHNCWKNLTELGTLDQLKFVIGDEKDYSYALAVLDEYPVDCPIYFQPAYKYLVPEVLAAWILRDTLDVSLSLQLHKIIWGASVRGV